MRDKPIDYWWERRREGELTTEYLGRVLDELGLQAMATEARRGRYDDYFCPSDIDDGMNMIHLVSDLHGAAGPKSNPPQRRRIREVIRSIKEVGEFDGTKEESDRWAASAQGQAVMRDLVEGR